MTLTAEEFVALRQRYLRRARELASQHNYLIDTLEGHLTLIDDSIALVDQGAFVEVLMWVPKAAL